MFLHTAATAATWTAPHVLALSCVFLLSLALTYGPSANRGVPKDAEARSTLCGGIIGVVDKA